MENQKFSRQDVDVDSLTPDERREYLTNMKQAEETAAFTRNVDPMSRGSMLPHPPKPGELIYCQICRKAMLPKDFSEDPGMRRREFKWQIHAACMNEMFDMCDRSTPGLMGERGKK